MSGRATKKIPEFIYFVGDGNYWIQGPYVNPKKGYINRKFKLVEVLEEPIKKVAVISLNIDDFLEFKATLSNVKKGDRKNRFTVDNTDYLYIKPIDGTCGHTFDDVIETEKAKLNENYNNIKAAIIVALKPKQNDI
jgi:hypothetical protein